MYDFWHFWDQTSLGAGDFSCAVSGFGQVLKSDPREKPNSEDFRPAADEAPRHTREKISGTQGRSKRTVRNREVSVL